MLKVRIEFDIKHLKLLYGNDTYSQLLFIHVFTGCDSTSRIFSIEKKCAFQKCMENDQHLLSSAKTFLLPDQTKATIGDAGCQAMCGIFGGKCTDSLSSLRYNFFSKKVVSANSFVTPERLLPTVSSAKYHSLRVYYQVMEWVGKEKDMNPTSWGWKLNDNQFVPIMSHMTDSLLKVVHCNITLYMQTYCSALRCTCRRFELSCTAAFGQCQLESCGNPYNGYIGDNDSDDEEL